MATDLPSVRDLDAELRRLLEEDVDVVQTPTASNDAALEARIVMLEAQLAHLDVDAITARFEARVETVLVDASLQAAQSVKRYLNSTRDTADATPKRPHTR